MYSSPGKANFTFEQTCRETWTSRWEGTARKMNPLKVAASAVGDRNVGKMPRIEEKTNGPKKVRTSGDRKKQGPREKRGREDMKRRKSEKNSTKPRGRKNQHQDPQKRQREEIGRGQIFGAGEAGRFKVEKKLALKERGNEDSGGRTRAWGVSLAAPIERYKLQTNSKAREE